MKTIILLVSIFLIAIVFYSCESNDATLNNNTPASTVPQLLSPTNYATLSTLQPSFDWNDFPDAMNYNLQVSTNAAFTSLILDTSGLTTSSYTSSEDILNDSNSYFWRVRVINGIDTTAWSSEFTFATSIESVNPTNKVLVEIFTNTSCIPCVEANSYLDEIDQRHNVTSNDANVVLLRFHTTLFANDPFYLYNQTDNNARMDFYPNSAIVNPRTFLVGTFIGNYSAATWTNKINEKLADTRTYAIKLTNSYDSVSRTGNVSVKIKQVSGAVLNDAVYQIAIAETDIPYNAPNGETHFDNTFRDFITPPTGQPFTISPGATNSYNASYSIASQINQNNTSLVVFVQRNNTSGRDVLAVEEIKVK